jgi:hypothetical protein
VKRGPAVLVVRATRTIALIRSPIVLSVQRAINPLSAPASPFGECG